MWKFLTLFLAFVISVKSDELYMTSVPSSIAIHQDRISHLQPNDVSNFINFLLGFSAHSTDASYGVRKIDVFNRPEGNIFVNVFLPDEVGFSPLKFEAEYNLDNANGDHVSFLATSAEIFKTFGKKSLLLDYEISNQNIVVESSHPEMTEGLPTSWEDMEKRLQEPGSVINDDDVTSYKCLSTTDDVLFFSELQMLADVAAKVTGNPDISSDGATDFIYLSLSSITNLADAYGADSCQVKEAIETLEKHLQVFIQSIDEAYNGKLLSEVRTCVLNQEKVFSRQRRAAPLATNKFVFANNGTMTGMQELRTADFAIIINIGIWVGVVIALAVLAASYTLWFMDPGRDNIVYRMTMTRMKSD